MTTIRIGTRNSPLALAQANWVARALEAIGRGDVTCKLVSMTTTGDQLTDRSLLEAGGKGLFTKELDIALLRGEVDILVHSLKDVPVELPIGQRIMAYPTREDARDAFVSLNYRHFEDLPQGAVLGTSSLRRGAFALARRPDLKIVEFRGNVQTRLKKLADGVADGTFLAAAGLNRLGMSEKISGALDPHKFVPAVGQGILAIAAYPERLPAGSKPIIEAMNDDEAERAAIAERTVLARLDGSCRTPIAAHLFKDGVGCYRLVGCTAHPSGAPFYRAERELERPVVFLQDFREMGKAVAADILEQADGKLPHLEGV